MALRPGAQLAGARRVRRVGQHLAHREPDAARGHEAARERDARRPPRTAGPRSRPCRRRPARPPPARRRRARARRCRARRGRPRPSSAASSARTRASRPRARWRAPGQRNAGARWFVVAMTRTGSPARPSSAAREHPPLGVLRGARGHQHERLVARRQLDGVERALPQQRPGHAHRRMAVVARVLELGEGGDERQLREMPPWVWSSGGSPTWARASFSSPRPRSSPRRSTRPGQRPSTAEPAVVRGSRAPIEYGGRPASPVGRRWGISVAHGSPSRSRGEGAGDGQDVGHDRVRVEVARRAGWSRRWRARPPRTSSARGPSARPRTRARRRSVMPSRSTSGRQRFHVCTHTTCPRRGQGARPVRSPGTRGRDRRTRRSGTARARRSGGQLRDVADHLRAALGVEGHRAQDQRADARVAVDGEPLGDLLLRPAPGRSGRSGRPAAPPRPRPSCRRGRGPGPRRPRPRTRSAHERVVEVLLARAHAARRTGRGRGARSRAPASMSSSMRDVDHRRDVERVVDRLPVAGRRRALLEQRAELADVLGARRRSGSQPSAISPVSCGVLRPDRGDVDRHPLLDRADRELQRLAGAVRAAAACRSRRRTRAARGRAPCARCATYSRVRWSWRANGWPCQPSATCGPDEPMPRSMRPPESWSSVAAVIAVIAGVRPGIWKIAEPILMRLGLRGEPGEDRRGVGPVRLGGPDGVEADALGLA